MKEIESDGASGWLKVLTRLGLMEWFITGHNVKWQHEQEEVKEERGGRGETGKRHMAKWKWHQGNKPSQSRKERRAQREGMMIKGKERAFINREREGEVVRWCNAPLKTLGPFWLLLHLRWTIKDIKYQSYFCYNIIVHKVIHWCLVMFFMQAYTHRDTQAYLHALTYKFQEVPGS